MKIEHFALNVPNPVAMAEWYGKHLQTRVRRALHDSAQTHFLEDAEESVMLEIYRNPPDQVPDYGAMNPLQLHLAFVSRDPNADAQRLITAGASFVEKVMLRDGSELVMLRDPWGLALQLCKRPGH